MLLPLSVCPDCCAAGRGGAVPAAGDVLVLPVINSLLNASTSSDALGAPDGSLSATGRSCNIPSLNCTCFSGPEDSRVASVLENGFGGAPDGEVTCCSGPEFRRVLRISSSSLTASAVAAAHSNGSAGRPPTACRASSGIWGGGEPE